MSRTSGITIQNNFSQGLITESTPLNFPKNAAVDSDNVNFDYTGRVFRRQEIDLELNYSLGDAVSYTAADVYTEYTWSQSATSGTFSFFVQQAGNTIHFYETTGSVNLTQNKNAATITLSDYAVDDTQLVAGNLPCQYAQGNGALIIVNRAIEPILITYNPSEDTFEISTITIKYRDFKGLSTPYTDVQRPAFSDLNALLGDDDGVRHYYNLLNQGWWQGTISGGKPSTTSALGQWDADTTSGSPAVGTFPSNSDYVGYYRASATDSFDPARLISFQQGSTLAPKGHFILPVGDTDRKKAVTDSGYTLDLSGTVGVLITPGTGTVIAKSGMSNTSQAFDSNYNYSTSLAKYGPGGSSTNYNHLDAFIGKDFGSGGGKKIISARWYGFKDSTRTAGGNALSGYGAGFHNSYKSQTPPGGQPTITNYPEYVNVTLQLRGSNSAPNSDGSNGTLLGSTTFSAGSSAQNKTITSSNAIDTFRYVWIRASYSGQGNWPTGTNGGQNYIACSEIELYESVDITNSFNYNDPEVTMERPQTCAYYAGRAWYGAINTSTYSTTLFFSQIIEDDSQYGKCYQQNDPTSENFFDLLDSDGGAVVIPEMGILQTLFVYQTTLILFASNGVWIVRGSSGNSFKATDYVVRKISSQGMTSPQSIADIEGIPYWWSDAGILRIEYNPQFDSFSVDSITDTTIRSFYLDIPQSSRSLAKGTYDQYLQYCYWLYNSGNVNLPYCGKILIFNKRTNGFFAWSTDTKADTETGVLGDVPGIVGIKFIQDVTGNSIPTLKLTTVIPIDDSTQYLTYSDVQRDEPTYYDWSKWANEVEDDEDKAVDFNSYFVTNYELDGDTQRFVQPNYVMLFIDQPYDADGNRIEQSAFLRGVFDFAISGDTGKWSSTAQSSQQIFNENLPNRSVNFRRLKIRGKGRCLQFRVHSESGKPFSVIGWSVWKTANSQD